MTEVKLSRTAALGLTGTVGFVASMFTIGMGLGRSWSQLEPEVFADTFPDTFLFLLPTVALTLPFAIYGTWRSMQAATPGSTTRRHWRVAFIGLLISTAVTAVYHVPANYRIWQHDLTASEISTELDRWLLLHAVRLAIAVVALVAAFRAVTTPDANT
ncbi:MAG: hypothetical protein AAGA65_22490 [Actinomycetota bacterium]